MRRCWCECEGQEAAVNRRPSGGTPPIYFQFNKLILASGAPT